MYFVSYTWHNKTASRSVSIGVYVNAFTPDAAIKIVKKEIANSLCDCNNFVAREVTDLAERVEARKTSDYIA